MKNSENSIASIQRRLAGLVYDGLLLFAITMLAGFLLVPFMGEVQLQEGVKKQTIFNPLMTAYYLSVYYFFFGWFWTHGGQTLGMRAWHTKLVTLDNQALDWKISLVRFVLSLPMWFFWVLAVGKSTGGFEIKFLDSIPNELVFALAAAWLVVDHLPNNWRDKVARTKIIYMPK